MTIAPVPARLLSQGSVGRETPGEICTLISGGPCVPRGPLCWPRSPLVSSRAWPGGRVCTWRPPQWGSGSVAPPAPRGALTLPGPGARGAGLGPCCRKRLQTERLKTRVTRSHSPGARSQIQIHRPGPSEAPGGSFRPSSASGGRWQPLAGQPIPPVSAAIIPCPPPLCICA